VARRCVYCEKQPVVGNKISHSNIKTKIRHYPNLQKVRAFWQGVNQRVYACTRCLRSGFVTKPLVSKYTATTQPGSEVAQA
jgi:large subunit ribosomal protein L28